MIIIWKFNARIWIGKKRFPKTPTTIFKKLKNYLTRILLTLDGESVLMTPNNKIIAIKIKREING